MGIRVNMNKVMEARGVGLTELSDRIGVSPANLSSLKSGRAEAVRFSTLAALCRALDCTPGELFDFDPDTPDDEAEK